MLLTLKHQRDSRSDMTMPPAVTTFSVAHQHIQPSTGRVISEQAELEIDPELFAVCLSYAAPRQWVCGILVVAADSLDTAAPCVGLTRRPTAVHQAKKFREPQTVAVSAVMMPAITTPVQSANL